MNSLEGVALNSFYSDVLTSLFFCSDSYVLGSSQFKVDESSFRCSERPLDRARVRQFFNGRLALCPRGLGSKVRDDLLERFTYELFFGERQEAVGKLQWSFLNVVLDESVKGFNCYLSGREYCSLAKLMQKIAEHSPFLEKLTLVFNDQYVNLTVGEMKQITGGPTVKFLNNLTHLQLDNLSKPATRSFCYIGDSCPNLVGLYLGAEDIELVDKDILNLFLGKRADNLQIGNLRPTSNRHNSISKYLHKYQFGLEELQPFCVTLKHIDIGLPSEQYCQELYGLSPPTIAFVLRHLPSLLRFGIGGEVLCDAIHLLSVESSNRRPAAKRPRMDDSSIILSPFIGFLPLESIQCLNLADKKLVEAVTSLCPRVKNADVFVRRRAGRDGCNPNESVLKMKNAWPNLQSLQIFYSGNHVRSLLETFGSKLLKLKLHFCRDVHPLLLRSCSRLETLELISECSFVEGIAIPPGSFLPNLKKMRSEVCLGEYAECFLRKPSLVDVELLCFSLLTTSEQWQTIRDMWPQLECFRFHYGKGLTQDVVRDAFSRYCRLKRLAMPKDIFCGRSEIWTDEKQISLYNFAASLELLNIRFGTVEHLSPFTEYCHDSPPCSVCRWWED